jgi:tetratricopeptide (TPR) repeat protein
MKPFFYLFTMLLLTVVKTFPQAPALSLAPEQREAFIQKALAYRKSEDYKNAIAQLDSILKYSSTDAPAMLFRGDLLLQAGQFSDAVNMYKKLLAIKYEFTIVQINLSYALFMNHQPSNALHFAKSAWEHDKTNNSAIVNYFNAMLWNIKTKSAARFLQQQQTSLTGAQTLVLKARLFTTSGDYTNGLKYYDSLVSAYPDKYYIQEYAEVLLGKKEAVSSEKTMRSHSSLFSSNEYKAYQEKLKTAKLQNAGTEFVYFVDVAKNTRIENTVWWQQKETRTYRFKLSAGSARFSSAQQENATVNFVHVTCNERWNKAWSGQTDIHIPLIQIQGGKNFTAITGKQLIKYQPNDRRMFGLKYSKDVLNFTTALLEKNIGNNSFGYVAHVMVSGKTGIYSEGSWGILTDQNQSQQFFGSLYHVIRTEPTFKTGINFSLVHYKDSTVKNYFSPNRYMSTEVFADYSTSLPELSKYYLQVQAAAGYQKIENQKWDAAFRFQAEGGFRLKHIEAGLKYQTSNVAANTGTGYKFNWFIFRCAWRW